MITTYHLHVTKLSVELIDSIKTTFKDKNVRIVVSDEINTNELREYIADKDSFKFWTEEENDLYPGYDK